MNKAALKNVFLAIHEAAENGKGIHHLKLALQSFRVMFGDERVPPVAL